MNIPTAVGLIAAVASVRCASVSASVPEPAAPNFVFIMADDCTYHDIGCCGGQARTPHIDQLAAEGMRFTRCFQAAPMCSPTRHNIYTALSPVRSGAYPNHTFTYDHVRSVVHYLKPLGYRVALSGKTHINPKSVFPFEYSADRNNPDMTAIDGLMSECRESATPFCLFACSNEPHTPWNKGDASAYPPAAIRLPPYLPDTPEMRAGFSKYLAEITYFDGQVGSVLSLLKKHGLEDNTLVMVVSEQGNSLPFAKWTCYDNGVQSTMIVRFPGAVTAGRVTDALVAYEDIVPTFLEAAGAPVPDGLDGRSFLNVLRGEAETHREHVFSLMTTRGIINGSDAFAIRSVRTPRYRLILNLNHDAEFTNAATKDPTFESMKRAALTDPEAARLVHLYQHRPPVEFFDCDADPYNMRNLADDPAHAGKIAELRAAVDEWMRHTGDKGIATELAATERQPKKRGNRRGNQRGKKP